MKSTKKLAAFLLSASIMCTAAIPAFAATASDTGANKADADSVEILGLGGVYRTNESPTFNAIIPAGFSAVRLYDNDTEIDFTCKQSETTNNYRVSFGGTDIKVIGENKIRLEADYIGEGGAIVTKSDEKMLNSYAKGPTQVYSQNFDALADDFDTLSDTKKAEAIKGNVTTANISTSLDSKSGALTITNEAIEGDLRGKAGNKVLKFAYGTKKDMGTYQIVPSAKTNTQILNFRFYPSGKYALDVALDVNESNDERLLLHNMELNTWHDVGIIYDPSTLKATAFVDGKKTEFALKNGTFNNIRIRPTVEEEGSFVAFDEVTLSHYNNKIPDVASLAYFSDELANRQTAVGGVVPAASAKALVMTTTRGGANPAGYVLDANGERLTGVTLTYTKIEKDASAGGVDTYHFTFAKDSGTFAEGKYTAVLTGGTFLAGVAMQAQLRRDFYVVGDDGANVTLGDCAFDGSKFSYNLSYERLADKKLTIIAAVYDGDMLTDAKIIGTEAGHADISGSLSAAGTKAKLMVWDETDSQVPFIPAGEYTAAN